MLCTRAVTWGHVSYNPCDQEYPDTFYCTVIQWDTCSRTTGTFWPRLFILLFLAELATPFSTMFLQSLTSLCIVFLHLHGYFVFHFSYEHVVYFGSTPILVTRDRPYLSFPSKSLFPESVLYITVFEDIMFEKIQ